MFSSHLTNLETKSTKNCSLSHHEGVTSGLSPVPPSPSLLHLPTSPGKLTPGCRGNPLPGCASWPGAEGSVWCIGHSQHPGASAASAAPGTASAGPSCGGRGLEGSASTVLLVRGLAGEAGPEGAVPAVWCCQGRAGTHLRFSSSLCTDLPMPGRME